MGEYIPATPWIHDEADKRLVFFNDQQAEQARHALAQAPPDAMQFLERNEYGAMIFVINFGARSIIATISRQFGRKGLPTEPVCEAPPAQ